MFDKKVTLKTTEGFIDSLIFSSCRYYIGRRSIQACTAAGELAEFLVKNDVLSKERRKFLARDIRDQINQQLHFYSNVHVDGFARNGEPDALILISRKIVDILKENNCGLGMDEYKKPLVPGEFNPAKYDWTIDLATGEVEFEETKDRDKTDKWAHPIDYYDAVYNLASWCKIAGWLDPYISVSAQGGGVDPIVDEPAFEFPMVGRYAFEELNHVKVGVITCSDYLERPGIDVYIEPEYITKLQNLT